MNWVEENEILEDRRRLGVFEEIIADVHKLYESVPGQAGKWNKLNDIYTKHGYHPVEGWLPK